MPHLLDSLRARHLGCACLILAACGGDVTPAPGPAAGPNPTDPTPVDRPTKTPPTCVTGLADFQTAPSPVESLVHDVAATEVSIVAAMADGLVRSLDGGASWSAVPLSVTRQLVADEAGYVALGYDGVIYVGDATGAAFVPVTAGLPDGVQITKIATGGGVVLAVAGGVVYRWNGASWDALALPAAIEVVATDGERILAASHGELFASTDGATWSPIALDATPWGFSALAIEGDRMLAAHFAGLARSDDGGATWTTITDLDSPVGIVTELLVHGDGALAAGYQGTFASTDGGATWSAVPDTASFSAKGLARHGDRWFVAGGRVKESTDGLTWSAVDSLRTRRVEAFHAAGGALFATSEDGFTHRLVAGDWQRFDAPDALVAAAEHEGAIFGVFRGVHYTDLARSTDGGATWSLLPYVGGAPTARIGSLISVQGTLLAGSTTILGGGGKAGGTIHPGIGIQRSHDGGATWHSANAGLPTLGYYDADTTVHPQVVSLFAAGDDAYAVVDGVGLLRSTNAGTSWTLLDPLAGEDGTMWLDVGAAMGGGLIAGARSSEGVLLRVDDEGVTSLAAAGLPEGFRVAGLWAQEEAIFATLHGEEGIYVSHDGGESFALEAAIGDARALAFHEDRLWIAVRGEGVSTAALGCD